MAAAMCTTLDWERNNGYDEQHRYNTVIMCLPLVYNNYKEHTVHDNHQLRRHTSASSMALPLRPK